MFSADLGVNQVASNPAGTNPPFQKVALLLHGDGTNGAQNNTFLDSSTNNFTITRTGNVAQGTFSPFSLAEGQWSNYLDGTGDYLTVTDSAAFAPNTGAFTWECWFYPTDVWSQTLSGGDGLWFSSATNGIQIGRTNTATGNAWGLASRGTAWRLTTTTLPTVNQWNHMVVVRSGTGTNETAIFLNGVRVANGTVTASFGNSTGALEIGRGGSGFESTGYLSNVRFVNGSAVYDPTQSTITVPTSPLTTVSGTSLLTCQSNRFKDNSSNNFTITRNGDTKVTAFSPFAPSAAYSASTNGGSGYFDGSGDRLQIADTSSLDLNGSAFNVEYWIYPLASPATITVTGKMSGFTTNPTAGWSMWLSSMRPTFGINGVFNSLIAPVANAIRVGEWSHIAASSDGSTYTNLYVNGVRVATTSSLLTNNTSLPMVIGSNINGTTWNADYPVTGYIQDLRVVKGTAIYTGTTYTVPTAPLTAVANTQLLLNCTNAGIIDNAGKNDIETVGNAQVSTSVKKYGTGSMYFDGSGDSLDIAARPEFVMGTGDFTIELWFNINALPALTSNRALVDLRGLGSFSNIAPCVSLRNTSGSYYVRVESAGTVLLDAPISLSTGAWYHVAVVRYNNNGYVYINGIQSGSSFTWTTNYTGLFPVRIGNYSGSTASLDGYLDDIRISKAAVYTSNFTPPTQAFPNV